MYRYIYTYVYKCIYTCIHLNKCMHVYANVYRHT